MIFDEPHHRSDLQSFVRAVDQTRDTPLSPLFPVSL